MDGFITTSTGTRVHKKAVITKPELLIIGGGCVIHAEAQLHCFPRMSIGQKVVIEAGAVVRAPSTTEPALIGDQVCIGPGALVEARLLGSGVVVEAGAVVGPRCTLHDGVLVTAGSVVAPGTLASPGTVLHGLPALPVAALQG